MRIIKDKSITREAYFKEDTNIDSELDDIEAKFVRRLKKGSGKYQGKLPFKCLIVVRQVNLHLSVLTRKRIRTLMMKLNTNLRNIVKRKVCVQTMMTPQKT
jgi:hypothetical protein